jgi:hypothetical protein
MLSRAGWLMLGIMALVMGLLGAQYAWIDLSAVDTESTVGLLFIMLIIGGVLLPVPGMEIMWYARGRVVVDITGLRWRGWGAWNERTWGEILAVGMPPPDSKKMDDERIHVVTEDDYEFIHGFGLRDREELRRLLRSYGDLDEAEVVGKHTFLCRPGTGKIVAERAREHVDLDTDDYDFWATRFRRF